MENMRELLRRSLGQSLGALSEADRLAAAWPVACGKQMAEHGVIVGFAGGMLQVEVSDALWLEQMLSMRGMLERELAKIAAVKVAGIHFEIRGRRR